MTTWHDSISIAEEWDDASTLPSSLLATLLEVAKGQVVAYAPTLPPYDQESGPEEIPERYRLAHLRQTQNLWNAQNVDAAGVIGDGSTFTITPHPMDWHVKNILRPRRGVPHVG